MIAIGSSTYARHMESIATECANLLQGSAPTYSNVSQRNAFAESNREWSRIYAKRKYAKQRKVFVE